MKLTLIGDIHTKIDKYKKILDSISTPSIQVGDFGLEQEHIWHLGNITSDGLQAMFEIHQPDIWIFGHHHKSIDTIVNGTRFICLKEADYITIDLDSM